MNVVSRFEGSLLTIARMITGRVPLDEAIHLLRREHVRPKCLGRTAMGLLQQTLSLGMVHRLATWGWQDVRHVQGGAVRGGRLWQRVPLAARRLAFSPASVELLVWLTAEDMTKPARPLAMRKDRTVGDELLLLLAYLAIDDTPMAEPLLKYSPLSGLAVTRLLAPEAFVEHHPPPEDGWPAWLAPERSWIMEVLQPLLARRWQQVEQAKQRRSDRVTLVRHSVRQHQILVEYLEALEVAGRRDLARFLLVMAGRMLLRPRAEREWFANLQVRQLRLAEREDAYRAALAVLGELERLERWQHEATGIGYYDEEYAASQLWKSDWEALRGAEVSAAAAALVRHYTGLKQWESVT